MATKSKPAAPDYLALCLLAITLVNLNGVVTVLTQTPETMTRHTSSFSVFFVFALPISLYLIGRYARISNMGDIFGLFLLFVALYLFGSIVPSLVVGDLQAAHLTPARIYISSAILTSAFYFWAATLSDTALVNVLRISKFLLLIACFSTIFSDQFNFYNSQANVERLGGFNINSNSAAFVALYSLVLVAAYPARSRLGTLAEGSIAVTALVLTFSRTGLLTFLLLCLLFIFNRPSTKAVVLFLIGVTLFTWALWSVFEHDLFGLSWHQRQRLADVLDLVTGQATERTVGPRALLFDTGLHKIAEAFPWGAGINKMHAMEYTMRSPKFGSQWLGVHNTYLMILGEAGLLAFVAFLAFWARTIWKLANSAFRTFAMGATVVMLSSMMTTHAVLGNKTLAALLAFVMVIAARAPGSRTTFFPPEAVPGGSQP